MFNINDEAFNPAVFEAIVRKKQGYIKAKRIFDIALTIPLLIVLSPVLLIVSLLIKLTSKGPVLFLQKRIGFRGEEFTIYKFRSMRLAYCKNGICTQKEDDMNNLLMPKISEEDKLTPIGNFLRKSSIDELPQLINVLKGEMSLVGPRPLATFMVLPFENINKIRSLAMPGITGLWQVKARDNKTNVFQKIPWDIEYLKNMSIWMDIKILAQTLPVVIKQKGAG
jgi:lipopolysaccharide/colanic/teichoic acid biosynthesis glycosyltransferase